jgi:NADH-quinone oxidoreductase subunit L
MPLTYAVMTIGTIAITGLGVPGVFGFAGFYSKDTIIESAFAAGQENPIAFFAFVICVLAAGLTAYYSWRVAFFTFNGHGRWAHDDAHGHDDAHAHAAVGHAAAAHAVAYHDDDHATAAQNETHSEPLTDPHGAHGDLKPHESPLVMMIPLLVLSVGAVAAGFVFEGHFVGHEMREFWRGAIFTGANNHVIEHAHHVPTWVKWSPLVFSIIGLAVAAYVYLLKEGLGARLAQRAGPLYNFFYNKWYFDELYEIVFVRGAKALGDLFWKGGDRRIIDGLGPNGFAAMSALTGRGLGRLQTGYVYHYAFVMLLGVAGLLTWALVAWG